MLRLLVLENLVPVAGCCSNKGSANGSWICKFCGFGFAFIYLFLLEIGTNLNSREPIWLGCQI